MNIIKIKNFARASLPPSTTPSYTPEYVTLWHLFIKVFVDVKWAFLLIVFGLFLESFIGVEQVQGYTVQAGYQKGAASAATNLVFNVLNIPGTASVYTSYLNSRI